MTLAARAVALLDGTDDPNLKARIWRVLAERQRAAGDEIAAADATARALALYEERGNLAAAERLLAALAS